MTQGSSAAYRYRAATARGDEVEGVVRADSPRAAMDELRRQALVPVELSPSTPNEVSSLGRGRSGWGWGFGDNADDARAVAMRTIATMLAAGATLDRSLGFATEHAANADVKHSLDAVRATVRVGGSLSDALQREERVFGALAPAVARAGEESGTLDRELERLAEHFERGRELRATLRQALWYPALMGIVSGIGVIVMLTFVVPRFVQMLGETGGEFPPSTRALVALSAFVRQWWWVLVLIAGSAWMGAAAWLREPANLRRWHKTRLQWPIVGPLELAVCAARFARAFGVLLGGGVGVLNALRIASASVPNAHVREQLSGTAGSVGRGAALSSSLEGILPPLATQLLAVGEESGGAALGEMSLKVADRYDADSQRMLRGVVAMVEPVMIVLFGGIVGFVALAMLQAVYAINGGIA